MKEIHEFFVKVIDEIKAGGEADLKDLAADLRQQFTVQANDLMKQFASASPDIQAALKNGLTIIDQMIESVLVARGL